MRVRILGVGVGLLALTAACSGGAPSAVIVNNQVNVAVNGGPSEGEVPPSIDLNDPRIAVAQTDIEKLLGRKLAFEVDRTLIPAFGHGLHGAFVAALESTVTQLKYCQSRESDAFDYAVAKFQTLRWSYSAARDPDNPSFDPKTGLLAVLVPSDDHSLLKDYTLVEAFISAVELDRIARFEKLAPSDVKPGDYATYLDYQRRYHRTQDETNGRQPSSEERELRRISNVLQLYQRLPSGEVQNDARHWLVSEGNDVKKIVIDEDPSPEVSKQRDGVRAQWIKWLNQNQASLTRDEQQDIADLMFSRQYVQASSFRQGFKALEFASPHLRAWLKQQATPDPEQKEDRVQQIVLCPYSQHRNEERLTVTSYCNGALYTDIFKQSGGPKKLAQLLVREKGDPLTATATLHVLAQLQVPAAATLLEALAADEQASRAALVALARFPQWGPLGTRSSDLPELDPEPLLALIQQWWPRYPTRRPELLYLLTQLGARYEGMVAWPKLPKYLGARISADELSGFLDQGPGTVWALRGLAKSFSEGWSRSALLIPKLEGWLGAYNKTGGDGPSPYYATERVVEALCVAGTSRDIKALQAFLRERIESFPSENSNLGSFTEKRTSELCPKFEDDPTPKGKPSVLFGD